MNKYTVVTTWQASGRITVDRVEAKGVDEAQAAMLRVHFAPGVPAAHYVRECLVVNGHPCCTMAQG